MKYLRLFEEHDTDDYYIEISREQFESIIKDKDTPYNPDSMHDEGSGMWLDFTDKEVRDIRYSLRGKKFKFSYGYRSEQSKSNYLIFVKNRDNDTLDKFDYKPGIDKALDIYKLDDEWFYVMYRDLMLPAEKRRMYYKCDQFDALIKFIEDVIK